MSENSSDQPGPGGKPLRRRTVLGSGLKAGAAALIPLVNAGCATQPPAPPPAAPIASTLGADLDAVLTAVADRLIPADALGPGAGTAGAARYVNRSLSEWNQNDVPLLRQGLAALDEVAFRRFNTGFANIAAEQQDALLEALEAGQLPQVTNGTAFFSRLLRLVMEAMFSDPFYGGNGNYAGWDLIGYPGAVLASTPAMQKMRVRLAPLHTSGHGAEHDGH